LKRIFRNTTVADRLLLLVLLAASIAGIFVSREAMSQSSEVSVEVNGRPAYTLPLDTDKTLTIEGPYGNTLIEIKDRRVRVREAHCPNQICVKQGWISRGVIVCLPNRIVVLVGGGKARKDVDAITG
jgi:hypothetical protein